MELQIIKLPLEVNELAAKVSSSKQAQVRDVLQQIFAGTENEQTKNLTAIMQKLEMYVTESELRKQTGVLITNKQALDIAKFVPLYQD